MMESTGHLTCPCGGFALVMSTNPDRVAWECAEFKRQHAGCVIEAESREAPQKELEP